MNLNPIFIPNRFQKDIFNFISDDTKGNLIVEALAGTGKTLTIIKALDLIPRNKKVLLLAYNHHIMMDLRTKAPKWVDVRTTHSVGLETIKNFNETEETNHSDNVKYKMNNILKDVIADRNRKYQIANNASEVIDKQLFKKLQFRLESVINHFRNALLVVNEKELNYVTQKYDLYMPCLPAQTVLELISESLKRDMEDTVNVDFTDMLYLPTAMFMQFNKYDFILVDETQDINESQLRMILMLREPKNGRIIAIGDRKQCVIEGTNISTNKGRKKVEQITKEDSIQCGIGNVVTDFVNPQDIFVKEVINKSMIKIITKKGNELITTPEHIHFARYQEGYKNNSVGKNFIVYLMYKEDLGYRVGFTKSHKARVNQENADKVWFLDSVETLREANYLEQLYSVKYGLPRWIFRTNLDNVSYTQNDIKNLFSSLNTESGAKRLLKFKNMYIEYPHHIPKCSTIKRRRNFSITMCGDWIQEKNGRKNPTMHRYSISGSSHEDGELLKSIGLNVRQAKTPGSWRVESSSSKLSNVYEILKQVQSVMDVNVIETARLGSRALTLTPASHVLTGMGIYIESDGKIIEDIVIDVRHEKYSGKVYDINVNRYHNYIANGIVTHNSLYGFRGADNRAMDKVKKATDADQLPLNICYRCPKLHIQLANEFVPEMESAPNAIDGEVYKISGDRMNEIIRPGDIAICRNNAPLIRPALALLKQGIKINIRGQNLKKYLIELIEKTKTNDVKEMVRMLKEYRDAEVKKLKDKNINPLTVIDKVRVIIEFSKDAHNVKEIINYINVLFNDKDAQITFSTVHGAKGTESGNIFFINSFLIPSSYALQEWEIQGEKNIMYVALTRSKNKLYFVDIHSWEPSETTMKRIDHRNIKLKEAIELIGIKTNPDGFIDETPLNEDNFKPKRITDIDLDTQINEPTDDTYKIVVPIINYNPKVDNKLKELKPVSKIETKIDPNKVSL